MPYLPSCNQCKTPHVHKIITVYKLYAIHVFVLSHEYGFKFLEHSYLNLNKESPESELRYGGVQISHQLKLSGNCLVQKKKKIETR